MESRFQTSFIPKKPMVNEPSRKVRVVNLFALLGTLIFLITAAGAAGIFFYGTYLEKSIASSKVTIDSEKSALDPELVKQIVRLDNRIKTARKLIDNHLATSHFFDQIAGVTLPSVRFKSFKFSFLGKDKVTVSMAGQATGFTAIALQSDVLNNANFFTSPIISGLNLEGGGTVSFDFSAGVDSAALFFKKYAQPNGSSVITEPVSQPATVIVTPVATTSTSVSTSTKK